MQIIHIIYYIKFYFLVIYNTQQDFKCITNMGCFEANSGQLDFNRNIVNI